MEDQKKLVEKMIAKAADTSDSADAMRFSQAALNAANAIMGLSNLKPQGSN